jgi:hypothetical protein
VHAPVRLVTHLNGCRGGLGAVLLFFPGLVVCLLASPPLERGSRRIIRLLGIRQLSQALVTGNRASVAVIGAEVDVAHAASMMTLALCSRRWRSAALVDAVIASLFALAGAAVARAEPPTAQDGTSTSAERRAARSARRFVPERLVPDPGVPDRSLRSAGPESPQGGSHA